MRSLPDYYRQLLKVSIIFCIIMAAIPKLQAQLEDFNVEISIKETSTPDGFLASINISVDKPDSQYEYLLYDKEPWNGGKLLKELTTDEQKAIFADIPAGNYYVCVKNSSKAAKCKDVLIKSIQK